MILNHNNPTLQLRTLANILSIEGCKHYLYFHYTSRHSFQSLAVILLYSFAAETFMFPCVEHDVFAFLPLILYTNGNVSKPHSRCTNLQNFMVIKVESTQLCV